MTRKEALAELIAKVEVGIWLPDVLAKLPDIHTDLTWKAYQGSLDAAKALHEAVLPRCEWGCGFDEDEGFGAGVTSGGREFVIHGGATSPARAWLLAILRALHSMEPDT